MSLSDGYSRDGRAGRDGLCIMRAFFLIQSNSYKLSFSQKCESCCVSNAAPRARHCVHFHFVYLLKQFTLYHIFSN